MQLSDTIENTDFLYLYVKKFKWTDAYTTELLQGHPIEKRVYRGSYNKDTKTYRIFYTSSADNKLSAIALSSLVTTEWYTSEIVDISRHTILSLDLTEGDLEQLIQWQKKDNADIKSEMIPPPSTLPSLRQETTNSILDVAEFISCASELYTQQPATFDAVHEIIHMLNDSIGEGDSIDSIGVSLSISHGAGYNIGKALDHLGVYMSDDRRNNLMEEDLDAAILNLINEKIRIRSNRNL